MALLRLIRVGFYGCAVLVALASPGGASDQAHPRLPNFAIGRCVRVIGVTAPEDAKTVGFDYLELALQDLLPLPDAEFQRIVERLQRAGLPAVSGYGYLPADLKIVGPDVDANRVKNELLRGLDRARQLGLQMVVHGNLLTRGRSVPDGFPRETAWKQLADFGRQAAVEAEKRGLVILFEPMPPRSTNLINTLDEAVALVEAVNHPAFRLMIDFGYTVEMKESHSTIRRAASLIRQVEIQNPNGRVYPRSNTEADYAGFFQALGLGGYRGGFSIHGKPEDVFVDAPRAIAMLRKTIDQALSVKKTSGH
jgi:sugar phosphate isomerase/epimerase